MTPDPAVNRERAHVLRRDPTAPEWPFRDHRPMSEIMRAELDAAVERAARRVGDAFDRSIRP